MTTPDQTNAEVSDERLRELLPCPLCNCPVELVLDHTVEETDWIRHTGINCGLEFSGPRGQVVDAWNRRSVTSQASEKMSKDEQS